MSQEEITVKVRTGKTHRAKRGGWVWMATGLVVAGLLAPISFAEDCNGTWDVDIGQPGLAASSASRVSTFEIFNNTTVLGGENELYAGGNFKGSGERTDIFFVAKWGEGNVWERIDGQTGDDPWLGGPVNVLHTWGTGSDYGLYIGGDFIKYFDGPNEYFLNYIVQWDGDEYIPLVDNSVVGVNGRVLAMASYDHDNNGNTPTRLVVGGEFYEAGGETMEHVAMWDGSEWHALGEGVEGGNVYALEVFNDGSGLALFVAGTFLTAGGQDANYIAKWQGGQWYNVGYGFNKDVYALTLHNDGEGLKLYAGGDFRYACTAEGCGENNGILVNGVAVWDGSSWSAVGNGIEADGKVRVLYSYKEGYACGSGPHLFAGGSFTTSNGPGNRMARWDGTAWTALEPDENSDGVYDGSVLALIGFENDDVFPYYPDPDNPEPIDSLFVGGSFSKVNLVDGEESQAVASTVCEWSCRDFGCIWDLDKDGQVNPVDVGMVQSCYGQDLDEHPECRPADIDGDCQVNPFDAGIVSSMYGECEE